MNLRRNVPVLAITVFAIFGSRLIWERLLPNYYAELGATDAQIGTAFSLVAASLALFQLIGGLLADRVGRKPVAVLPIFGVTVAVAWMARAPTWGSLLAGHLGLAAFASVQTPGFTSLLAESVPAEERGRAFSSVTFAARLAGAAGPAVGAWLLPVLGTFPALLWITVGVGAVGSLTRLALLRETGPESRLPGQTTLAWRQMDWGPAGRFLLIGTVYTALGNLLLTGPFIALHASQSLGLDEVQLNTLFAAGSVAAIVTAAVGGWLADRVGQRPTLVLGVVMQALGTLAWALLPPGPAASACFVLAAAGAPVANISYSALLAGVVGSQRRGAFIGLVGMLTGLLSAPAGRVGAELRAWGGSVAPFWGALALSVLLGLALAANAWRAPTEARTAVRGDQ